MMPAILRAVAAAMIVALALGGVAAVAYYQLLPRPPRYYSTTYLSFAIPDGWDCGRETTEIVCRNIEDETEAKRAIIILTAKETGKSDSFEAYRSHLARLPGETGLGDQKVQQTEDPVEDLFIGGRRWVIGRYLHSEVPDYFTSYFATTDHSLSVLVTISAHRDYWSDFAPSAKSLLENLELFGPEPRRSPDGAETVVPTSWIDGLRN